MLANTLLETFPQQLFPEIVYPIWPPCANARKVIPVNHNAAAYDYVDSSSRRLTEGTNVLPYTDILMTYAKNTCLQGGRMPSAISILVADDDKYLRTSLKGQLLDEGFDVMDASNGADAISLLQSKTFPLVILDLKMPEVNGMGVLRFLKTFSPSTKVIVLTSYADLAHGTAAAKEGADDFISKPYEIEDLLATVHRLLSA